MYAVFTRLKAAADYVAFVIPLYDEGMLAAVVYLAFAGGAEVVYSKCLRPLLKKHVEPTADKHLDSAAQFAKDFRAAIPNGDDHRD